MPGVRNVGSAVALMFVHVGISNFVFFNFLDLNKFWIILSVLLPAPHQLYCHLALKIFKAKFSNNLVVFDIEVNNVAILLKP